MIAAIVACVVLGIVALVAYNRGYDNGEKAGIMLCCSDCRKYWGVA